MSRGDHCWSTFATFFSGSLDATSTLMNNSGTYGNYVPCSNPRFFFIFSRCSIPWQYPPWSLYCRPVQERVPLWCSGSLYAVLHLNGFINIRACSNIDFTSLGALDDYIGVLSTLAYGILPIFGLQVGHVTIMFKVVKGDLIDLVSWYTVATVIEDKVTAAPAGKLCLA